MRVASRVAIAWPVLLVACSLAVLLSPALALAQHPVKQGKQMDGGRVLVFNDDVRPAPGPYVIRTGDVLEVSFFKTPELNRERKVGPDGIIHLPLIGSVPAAGRSVEDLTDDLLDRYSGELREPRVTVSVREFSNLKVYVAGEVNRPGEVEFRGSLTATQAIFSAGGFNRRADLGNVLLIRQVAPGRAEGMLLDVKDVLQRARFESDTPLAVSDILFVPRSGVAKVNDAIQQYLTANIPIPVGVSFFIDTK